eukprot:364752-Chlamydomonas_euryale.AAC.4
MSTQASSQSPSPHRHISRQAREPPHVSTILGVGLFPSKTEIFERLDPLVRLQVYPGVTSLPSVRKPLSNPIVWDSVRLGQAKGD